MVLETQAAVTADRNPDTKLFASVSDDHTLDIFFLMQPWSL